MVNTRGGGDGKGGKGVTKAAADAKVAPPPASGEAGAGGAAPVLDLIQPHSVSAEEVAGFYGCTVGKASRE